MQKPKATRSKVLADIREMLVAIVELLRSPDTRTGFGDLIVNVARSAYRSSLAVPEMNRPEDLGTTLGIGHQVRLPLYSLLDCLLRESDAKQKAAKLDRLLDPLLQVVAILASLDDGLRGSASAEPAKMDTQTAVLQAIQAKVIDPNLSCRKAAKLVGISHSSLSRNPIWKATAKLSVSEKRQAPGAVRRHYDDDDD